MFFQHKTTTHHMSDIDITPRLEDFQDCIEYMATQKLAMEMVEAKIWQLDNDPTPGNVLRDYEYRSNLILNYEWHAGEFNKALTAFNLLSAALCDAGRFTKQATNVAA